MKCRHCTKLIKNTFLDLGFAPPSNAYLTEDELNLPESYYPLKVNVCSNCWLVQTEDYTQAGELFNPDYAYFSSTSTSWLAHSKRYAYNIIEQLGLTKDSHVVEVASNDGYLLRNFLEAEIPCLGIEPTDGTAAEAEALGIPVVREFFGEDLGKRLANEGKQADLIVGNNVYAHVPDINDFTKGLKAVLKQDGTITLEFPHLMKLIEDIQFDTVYHEHFSYLSLYTVDRIFRATDLRIFDVEQLTTHGGSLRIYGCHVEDIRSTTKSVEKLLIKEAQFGLQTIKPYQDFQLLANKVKDDLLKFLIEQKQSGKKVVAYGAAAKGNTLLNYAGVKKDLLQFVCDASPAKQGKYMPGSHIPILPVSALYSEIWDFILILPWNISAEVMSQNLTLRSRGTQFLVAVPGLHCLR